MKIKHLFIFISLLFLSVSSKSQDKILLRDAKDTIICKIIEIGTTEIKYKESNNVDGPQISLEKSSILKIIYANGRVEIFDEAINATVKNPDKIYPRNTKSFIKAKIIEVGMDDIKYKDINNLNGPQFSMEKDDIEKIVYANGKVEKFEQSMAAHISIQEMHKNNIQFALLSARANHLHFSFERGVKQGQSWTVHATIIGVGMRDNLSKVSKGFMVGGSYKFCFVPDVVYRGIRSRHIMQGSFFRPSIYFGGFSEKTLISQNISVKKNTTTGAIMAELGRQWIMSNRASFEYYFGFGYGFDNYKFDRVDYATPFDGIKFYYLYQRSGNTTSNTFLALSTGVKFGYLFHTPKEKKMALNN